MYKLVKFLFQFRVRRQLNPGTKPSYKTILSELLCQQKKEVHFHNSIHAFDVFNLEPDLEKKML